MYAEKKSDFNRVFFNPFSIIKKIQIFALNIVVLLNQTL